MKGESSTSFSFGTTKGVFGTKEIGECGFGAPPVCVVASTKTSKPKSATAKFEASFTKLMDEIDKENSKGEEKAQQERDRDPYGRLKTASKGDQSKDAADSPPPPVTNKGEPSKESGKDEEPKEESSSEKRGQSKPNEEVEIVFDAASKEKDEKKAAASDAATGGTTGKETPKKSLFGNSGDKPVFDFGSGFGGSAKFGRAPRISSPGPVPSKEPAEPISGPTIEYNVGGKVFEVSAAVINKHPGSMLANLAQARNGDDPIFVNGCSERFQFVLDYLVRGRAKLSPFVTKEAVLDDLDFLDIKFVDESAIMESKRTILKMVNAERSAYQDEMKKCNDELELVAAKRLFTALSYQCYKTLYAEEKNMASFTGEWVKSQMTDQYSTISFASNEMGLRMASVHLLTTYKDLFQESMAKYNLRCTNLEAVSLSSICFESLE